jgi:DNA-binding transcriptional ArsR family regulator
VTDDRVDAVFSALSDPTRRAVMRHIAATGEASATELAEELPISRQAVIKHLASLAEAGLVDSARAGRERRYRLTPAPMGEAMSWMNALGAEWDERLAALKEHLGDGSED